LSPPRSQIPVIALTADVVASNRNGYFAAGVNAIVAKPIDWQELSREMAKQTRAADKPAPELGEAAAPILAPDGPPAKASGAIVLDEVMLKSLVDALGEEIFAPMVTTFRNNMIQYRDDLKDAVAAGDLKKAKRTAHALKGLCAQFGAPRASSAAKVIEVDSKSLADVAPMLSEVAEAVAATEQALATRFPGW
jgi:HPt (histidine-containing phosphotransfer) domain-containing protein